MREAVLLTKIENLQNCVNRIQSKQPFSVEELKTKYDLQDIISINLQRAVQICVDISSLFISESTYRVPDSMAECFEVLRDMKIIDENLCSDLKKSVGLRNILVHEYEAINWEIIYNVITKKISIFSEFAKQASQTF